MTARAPVPANVPGQESNSVLAGVGQRFDGSAGNRDFSQREPGFLELVSELTPPTAQTNAQVTASKSGWFNPSAVRVTLWALVPATTPTRSVSEGSGYSRSRFPQVCRGVLPAIEPGFEVKSVRGHRRPNAAP